MPLTKGQILVLTNPQVRKRLASKASDFVYADQLLSTVGEHCTRLPAVWDRIFYGLDADTAAWLNSNFPGHKFTSTTSTASRPPTVAPARSLVGKAIEVLQSYKKTP